MVGGTTRAAVAAWIVGTAVLAGWAPARAQPRAMPLTAELGLARICASEAGLQTDTPDCAAIHEVLEGRRGRGSLLRIMRLYSTRVFDTERRDRRQWIAWLNTRGTEPRGWPEHTATGGPHPPWDALRARWMQLQRHARDVVEGAVPSPCAEPPDHWGGRFGVDLERARRAGWNEVDCGETLNAFWRVPRGGPADPA